MHNKKWIILFFIFGLGGCSGDGGGSGIGGTGSAADTAAPSPFTTPENLAGTVFDPANYTAIISSTLTGTWLLIESSEETLSEPNATTDTLIFHEASRQLVTIQESGNSVQIRLCDGTTLNTTRAGTTLTYDHTMTLDADESYLLNADPVTVTLDSSAGGYLYGALDSGRRDTSGFYLGLQYHLQRTQMFIKISPQTDDIDIGSVHSDLSLPGISSAASSMQDAGKASCFAESVRAKDTVANHSYDSTDRYERPTKRLILATDSVRTTFLDALIELNPLTDESGNPGAARWGIERDVSVESHSTGLSTFWGFFDISLQEKDSFLPATPQLLQQQYLSTATSLEGVIHYEVMDEFVHSDFSLHW